MAESGDLSTRLREGIAAARRGDKATGRNLLQSVIDEDPENELAWIWLASCMNTVSDRRRCLERVLEINPNNGRAKQALRALGGPESLSADAIDQLRDDAPRRRQRSSRQQRESSDDDERQGGGPFAPANLVIMLAVIVIVGGGLFLLTQVGGLLGGDEEPTATPRPVVAQPTAIIITPTLPPLPTSTPLQELGTLTGPTLPPSFTPTPPPTETLAPPATATPFPQNEFLIYFTSLQTGQAEADLYQMFGDGVGQERIAEDVTDIALDPAVERVAFVRNVTVTDEETEETTTFPELFVAPINDLGAAQQITEMRTDIVASPSWSPEAQEIIFVSDFDGDEDIWYVTPDGQNLRKLTENDSIDRDPMWRPVLGSRTFVFSSDLDSLGSTEVYVTEITEPGVEMIYDRLTNDVGSSYEPAWNANGSMIVFISDRQGDPDVYTMEADGRNQRLVTRDDGGADDRSPEFSPNSAFIAFVSNRQDDIFQTYLISVDSQVFQRLTTSDRNDISLTYRPELFFRLQQP